MPLAVVAISIEQHNWRSVSQTTRCLPGSLFIGTPREADAVVYVNQCIKRQKVADPVITSERSNERGAGLAVPARGVRQVKEFRPTKTASGHTPSILLAGQS